MALRIALLDPRRERAAGTVAQHGERRRLSRPQRRDLTREHLGVSDIGPVECNDDVALGEARAFCRAVVDHVGDDRALLVSPRFMLGGKLGREVLDLDAEPAAVDVAVVFS